MIEWQVTDETSQRSFLEQRIDALDRIKRMDLSEIRQEFKRENVIEDLFKSKEFSSL